MVLDSSNSSNMEHPASKGLMDVCEVDMLCCLLCMDSAMLGRHCDRWPDSASETPAHTTEGELVIV